MPLLRTRGYRSGCESADVDAFATLSLATLSFDDLSKKKKIFVAGAECLWEREEAFFWPQVLRNHVSEASQRVGQVAPIHPRNPCGHTVSGFSLHGTNTRSRDGQPRHVCKGPVQPCEVQQDANRLGPPPFEVRWRVERVLSLPSPAAPLLLRAG